MVKLNCDMGEGYGSWSMRLDEEIMPYIDMANIACGFHASDPHIMSETVAMAKAHNVSIGAHPGYPDPQGFGRRKMDFSAKEIVDIIHYQVGALQAICQAQGVTLDYVKPHGALYNTMMVDRVVMAAILQAISQLEPGIPLMIMANSDRAGLEVLATAYGVPLLFEAFSDRAYNDEGNLVARQEQGSVFHSIETIEAQVKGLIIQQTIISNTGKTLNVKADSLCVHGDNKFALKAAKCIRKLLDSI